MRAWRRQQDLHLAVEDDGAGLGESGAPGSGIGLANTVPVLFSAGARLPGVPPAVGVANAVWRTVVPLVFSLLVVGVAGSSDAAAIKRAEELLERTNRSVDQIAADVGFANAATLRHHFTRRLGTTPQAYRRTFRRRPA